MRADILHVTASKNIKASRTPLRKYYSKTSVAGFEETSLTGNVVSLAEGETATDAIISENCN